MPAGNGEFEPDAVIRLQSVPEGLPIDALIVHHFASSDSNVFLVSLDFPNGTPSSLSTNTPRLALLKLHDRRAFSRLRRSRSELQLDTEPFTEEHQKTYERYLSQLDPDRLSHMRLHDKQLLEDGHRTMASGEFETYLALWARKRYNAEVEVYKRLPHLQGRRIPRLYGVVVYPHARYIPDLIPGLLLEHTPSIPMPSLIRHDPPYPYDLIRGALDDAVRLVHEMNDQGVLNENISLDGIHVRQSYLDAWDTVSGASDASPSCFLTGLSHCRFRKPDESEENWRAIKWAVDEEGTIGHAGQRMIQQEYRGRKDPDDIWVYKPSLRYYSQLQSEN